MTHPLLASDPVAGRVSTVANFTLMIENENENEKEKNQTNNQQTKLNNNTTQLNNQKHNRHLDWSNKLLFCLIGDDVPRIVSLCPVHCRDDELWSVEHRAAAHGQDPVDSMRSTKSSSFQTCLEDEESEQGEQKGTRCWTMIKGKDGEHELEMNLIEWRFQTS